jgi:hypothetical protein
MLVGPRSGRGLLIMRWQAGRQCVCVCVCVLHVAVWGGGGGSLSHHL